MTSLWLLIPKSELMPRSPSAPRSQPMSSYPLYSSLLFCHSQAPISVTAKRPSPSQPSAHLRHSQAPCPATISVTPVLSWDANYFHKPSNISEGSNEVATLDLSAPGILTTGSRVYWEDCFPSTVPHSILIFSTSPFLFQHPWLSPSPFYLTLGHVIFPVQTIIHPWSP